MKIYVSGSINFMLKSCMLCNVSPARFVCPYTVVIRVHSCTV